MKQIQIPKEILAAEIRAGYVTLSGEGIKTAAGALGDVAAARAESGLKKTAESSRDGTELKFPPGCCNCLQDGMQVRSIGTSSMVSRGVEYSFRFQVPHCRNCAKTANRQRPGFLGRVAAFLIVGFPVFLFLLFYGAFTENETLLISSVVLGPLAGLALPPVWMKLRRPKAGQSSRYQAVYVSSIDVDLSGEPDGFTLAFENERYADRFLALNQDKGLMEN